MRREVIINITPMGAPRMTQRDKWKKRPVVLRYHAFKDDLRAQIGSFPCPDNLDIIAYMPMPSSWSKKKKQQMDGQKHQNKPDGDNIIKAIKDGLYNQEVNDCTVYDERIRKFWSIEPKLIIAWNED